MKREFLKNLGLEDEAIDKVLNENGKDIEAVKTKYGDYDDLKTQLSEANKQIQDFKGMDIDGIKTAAADWEKKAKAAETDRDHKVRDLKFNYALEGALRDSKARDTKSVLAHINREALEFDEGSGSIKGLDKQIESIREKHGYLFENGESHPRFSDKTGGEPSNGLTDTFIGAARKAAGLKE